MLDLNRLKNFIRSHPRLVFIVSGVAITGFVIFLTLLSRPTAPLPIIGPLTTPTPTAVIPSLYIPPTAVDLNQAENTIKVSEASPYLIPATATISLNLTKIGPQFALPAEPETISTQYMQVNTWVGPDYYLSHNLLAHQITLGRNNPAKIATTGTFRSPASLYLDAVNLVNSLQVFAPEIKFKLERSAYFSEGAEWPDPATPATAQYLELILTPQIANLPVYQQEVAFITATYDRANKLIKLSIINPLPNLTKGVAEPLVSLSDLQTRPSAAFFRLFVKPESGEQYFLTAPDIQQLTPDQLSLGLYLQDGLLTPVYLLTSQNYLYATIATAP